MTQTRLPLIAATVAAVVAVAAAGVAVMAPRLSDSAAAVTTGQDVSGAVVRQYILDNPEIIREAIETLQERERLAEAARNADSIVAARADLIAKAGDPVIGNPDGDVTLVEFFDYQCGYCKRAHPALTALIEDDPNLRVVLKEFPILGPASGIAARAALAAGRQDKYRAMHDGLMAHQGQLTPSAIMDVALGLNLDIERLRKDMEDPAIEMQLAENQALAQKIGVNGTPAFVVGDRLVPGAVPKEALAEMVAETRGRSATR